RSPPRALHSFPTRRSSDLFQAKSASPVWSTARPADVGSPPPFHSIRRKYGLSGSRKFSLSSKSTTSPGRNSTTLYGPVPIGWRRSEEHTSELQSREKLVCR